MISLQVNSDIVFYTRNQNGTLNPYMVDKTYVGKCILTESVEERQDGWTDITHNYKYPEGDTHAHTHAGVSWRGQGVSAVLKPATRGPLRLIRQPLFCSSHCTGGQRGLDCSLPLVARMR